MPICSRLRTLKAVAVAMATLGMAALAQANVFNVTHIGDAGAGSLRQAILDANANPGADTIQFTFAVGSPPAYLNVFSPLPAITGNTTIIGQGQTQVIVEIDPITNPAPFPLITITGAPTVEIRGLSFTRGGGVNGGAILAAGGNLTIRECTLYENSVTNAGGGVAVVGSTGVTLNIIDSSILSNTADVLGGGIAVSLTGGAATVNISGTTIGRNSNHDVGVGHLGGGLYVGGGIGPHTVNITASTIDDNAITFDGQGGGVYVDTKGGTLSLLNATINGNGSGLGSALTYTNTTLSVRSCTITANNTTSGGTAGCIQDFNGAGMSVKNTIISGNISGGGFRDLDPAQVATGNNNLIGIGGPFANGVNGNITGVTDPRLTPMNTNGGLTTTFSLMPDSPALDKGSNSDAPAVDQRGQMRPSDGDNDGMATADIGAFETQRYLVVNTNNSGLGSLRQAILDNNTAGGGFVKFAIPTIGQQKVIVPKSPLPMISRILFIDGWSQGGQTYQGPPLVEIDGVQVQNTIGLDIQWSDCIIRGLAITDFLGPISDGVGIKISTRFGLRNWVYGCYIGVGLNGTTNKGNGQFGVWIATTANTNTIGTNGDGVRDMAERNVISGSSINGRRAGVCIESNSNIISGNNIGTDVTGLIAIPNFNGMEVMSGSSNQIGTNPFTVNPAAGRNVISGNLNNGVSLTSLGSNNFVSGNLIGIKADGATALPNVIGVFVNDVNRTLVGGTSAGERNVISGNTQFGVLIEGVNAFGNLLQGDYIGTNQAGTGAVGNGLGGVLVRGGTVFNRIGAFADNGPLETSRRNVISGNGGAAVTIQDTATTDIRVLGNYIGLSADGASAIGNVQGVVVNDSPANQIGSPGSGRNFIGGQTSAGIGDGVTITGMNATGNKVQNNVIGATPLGAAAGNAASGVLVSGGAVGTLVGGLVVGEGNTIANNALSGVRVVGDQSLANSILGNSINANGSLGIDLIETPGIVGVTPNGPANVDRIGPNALQNYPVLNSITGGGIVTATLTAIGNTNYRIEFFSSASPDPSTFGEGRTYLGFKNVTTLPNGVAGPFSFPAAIPPGENYISATATRLSDGGQIVRGFPTQPGAPLGTSEFALSGAINTTPTTQNQSAATPEDTDVVITLLANDPDVGATATFRIGTLPGVGQLLQFGTLTPIVTSGTAVADAGGRVVFRPAPNQFGTPYTTFTFIANDGFADSNESTVTVNVTPVADTPSVTDVTTPENTQSTTPPGLVISRNSVDGVEVTNFKITGLSPAGSGTLFQNDGVTPINTTTGQFITVAQGNAGLKFTPAAGFHGVATFNVQASLSAADAGIGGGTAVAHITVTSVADRPNVTDVTTLEDTLSTTPPGLVITRNSLDGPEVTHFKVLGLSPGGQLFLADGTTAVNGVGTGSFITAAQGNAGLRYLPPADYNGIATLQVRASLSASDAGLGPAIATATITITPVNDRPSFTAANPPAVLEDSGAQVVSGWVTGFSPGPANESTQAVLGYLVSGVTNVALFTAGGQPTVDSAGALRYTPAPDAFGTSQFTVRVQDDGGTANSGVDTSLPQTFTITVEPVNDQPSFTAANPPAVLEDVGPVVVAGWVTGFSAGPANESTQTVQAYLVSGVTNASLFAAGGQPTVDAAGVLRYTPGIDANGTSQFTVRVQDNGGVVNGGVDTSAPQTFTITVGPVNDAPSFVAANPPGVMEDAGPQVVSGWAHTFTPGPPTALDELTQLSLGYTVSNVTNAALFAAGGQPTVDLNGVLRYTPAPNMSGTSQFTVRVQDNGGVANGGVDTSAPQTFTIVVGNVNDPPTFVAADPPPVLEDSGPAVVVGWAHDFSPGPPDEATQTNLGYTVSLIGNPNLFTVGGQPTVDATGTLRYTPAPDAFGTSDFTVVVRDSGGTASGGQDTSSPRTFMIVVQPVNDPPSFVAANPPSVLEDSGAQVVAGWAHNVSVGPLNESMLQGILGYTVSGVTNAGLFAAGGAPTVDNSGTLRYTPAPDAFGTSQFTVVLRDDGGTANGGIDTSAPQTFTITVGPVNDAPSFVASNPPPVLEDVGAVVINGWVTTFTAGPANEAGQAVLGYLISGVTNAALFTAGGQPTVDNAGVLRYTPAPDANGSSQFTVRVRDNGGTADGGVDTSTAQTFTIVVGPVNDAPGFTAANPPSVLEDAGAQTVAAWAHNFVPGPVTAVDETAQTNLGYQVSGVTNASLFAAGGQPAVDASGTLHYTAAADANGTSQFTVRVQDSGGTANGGIDLSPPQTFTITVLAVNDAPSYVAANPPPVLEDVGAVTITGWAHNFVPGPATATDETAQTVLGYTVSGVTNAALFSAAPTVDAAGELRYTPAPDAFGSSQFTVVVRDSGGTTNGGVDMSAPQTFTIVVGPVNDAPSFVAANPPAVLEDVGPVALTGWVTSVSVGPANENTQTVLGYLVSGVSNAALFAAGGQPTVDSAGVLRYTPAADAFGTSTFTVRVQDDGGTANGGVDTSLPQTFTITVGPVNDAPSFTASNPPAVLEDVGPVVVAGWATNFAPGPANESTQVVIGYTVSGTTNAALFAAGGQPTVDNAGVLRYTPAVDANGTSQFTVVVRDDGGTANGGVDTSAPQTFTITVGPVNDAPSFIAADPPAVLEDAGSQTVTGWAHNFIPGPVTAVDEVTQTNLGYQVTGVTNPALFSATPTVDPAGALHYTAAGNANGTSQFTVRVQDSGGTANGGVDLSAPQTFTITVGAVNDAPSFTAANPPAVLEDVGPVTVAGWVTASSVGPADEQLTQTILGYTVSGVTNAALFTAGGQPTVDNAGVLRYTPAIDANGTSQFTVVVRDNGGTANGGVDTSAPQTFTITVGPVNDAPGFIAADPPAVLEDSGSQTVAGWAHNFTPGPVTALDEATQTNLGYQVTGITNPALFSAAPTVDAAGALHYTAAGNANGTSQFTVRVQDSGGTANGGVDLSPPQTFTITVGAVNDAPSFIAANPPAVLEDVGPVVLAGWVTASSVGPADEQLTQTILGYTVSGVTNAALFTAGGQPTVDNAGVLRYTPAPDAFGSSMFTVVVRDSGGTANGGVDTSAPQTFIITVGPVNDAPTFVASNPPSVLESTGSHTVPLYVTGFIPGPANEASQTLNSVIVDQISSPALFAPGGAPTISTSGTLTYVLASGVFGSTTFRVRVMDDGGTADGGVDTSAPQTFTLRVYPLAVCQDVTIDARTSCPPLTVSETQVNLTPRITDPVAQQAFTYSRPLGVNFPIGTTPVIVTVTYEGNLVTRCTARVTVQAADCNNDGIPDACQGGGTGNQTDCNGDGIPDDCQCLWDDGTIVPADAMTANGQLSHLGSAGSAVQVADDFYLPPDQIYRLFGFRGQMFTNSLIKKARLEFYEDCNGAPVATPFKTFTTSIVESQTPATGGFTLVGYYFDLCNECFTLEGGKCYWVSLVGVSDAQGTDLSYWATTTPEANPQNLMGMPPFRKQGIGGPFPYPFNFGNWETTAQCCNGCANLAWKLTGEGCLVAWDNGSIELGHTIFDGKGQLEIPGCGSPSGADRANPTQPRTADNFVIRGCEAVPVCFVETWIWTNCDPVHGFAEIYENQCGVPIATPGQPFTPPPTSIVPGFTPILSATATKAERIVGATLVYNGLTLYAYKLTFCNPGWTLQGGRTYWISSGSTPGGSLNGVSLFACAAPPCGTICRDIQISPGMFLNRSITPLKWTDTGKDYAFRIAVRGSLGLINSQPAPQPVICAPDINHSGAVDIQDIFDYLSTWFTGCP